MSNAANIQGTRAFSDVDGDSPSENTTTQEEELAKAFSDSM
jgi:hypothetical protein